jgi:hypothetical protein
LTTPACPRRTIRTGREVIMSGCPRYAAFLRSERQQLFEAIAENRLLLSLQAGRDVGKAAAEQDFIERRVDAFDREFRSTFCRQCGDAEECPLFEATAVAACPSAA